MPAPTDPHDKLFRALLDDPERARALQVDHLPEAIRGQLADDPAVALEDGVFVDDDLRKNQTDRLFSARLKDGRRALIYTLLEHKSAPEVATPLQLMRYVVRIWERDAGGEASKLRALPPVIPLVIYHGKARWSVPTALSDMIDAPAAMRPWLPGFRYEVRDLGRMADSELASDTKLRVGLGALKYVAQDGGLAMLGQLLAEARDDPRFLELLAWYALAAYGEPKDRVREVFAGAASTRGEEAVMNALEEAEAKGAARGEATILLRQIERKFGRAAMEAHRARIERADAETLLAWSDRILMADRVEDIFE